MSKPATPFTALFLLFCALCLFGLLAAIFTSQSVFPGLLLLAAGSVYYFSFYG